eukprot:8759156-Alexandrium_andersonii.AAC.1
MVLVVSPPRKCPAAAPRGRTGRDPDELPRQYLRGVRATPRRRDAIGAGRWRCVGPVPAPRRAAKH